MELHETVDPELFIPVHGEYTHLVDHYELAANRGMDEDKIVLCTDGDQIILTDYGLEKAERISGKEIMIDEQGSPVSEELLQERENLSGEGFVLIRVVIDKEIGILLEEPLVESRGWVDPSQREEWANEIFQTVANAVEVLLAEGERDLHQISRRTRRATGQLVSERTGRRPTLIPIVEMR